MTSENAMSTGELVTAGEGAQCVVCESDEHDGDGWIFPIEDTEVVAIEADGLERELKEDARPICSIECKDEFERGDY